ncbi:MAG: hypothetical protein AAB522_03305, partial [Patescibacteria group bacterium]
MKNLTVLVVFAVLFFVASAVAQRDISPYPSIFGRQHGAATGSTAGAAVEREEIDEALEIASKEFLRVFVEKGFIVTPEEETAHLLAEVETFSQERRGGGYYRYYRDPEAVVYLTIRHRENHAIVAVGRGRSSSVRRAAEKAANDAAKKIKRVCPKREDWSIFLP